MRGLLEVNVRARWDRTSCLMIRSDWASTIGSARSKNFFPLVPGCCTGPRRTLPSGNASAFFRRGAISCGAVSLFIR